MVTRGVVGYHSCIHFSAGRSIPRHIWNPGHIGVVHFDKQMVALHCFAGKNLLF